MRGLVISRTLFELDWPRRWFRCSTYDSLNTLNTSTPTVRPKSEKENSFSTRASTMWMSSNRNSSGSLTTDTLVNAKLSRALVPPRRRQSEEHTSELQSRQYLVCRLLLEKKKK